MSRQMSPSKISQDIANDLKVDVSNTTSYSESAGPFTIKAETLTAIRITWLRQFTTGTVTVGAATYTYDATIRLSMSVPQKLRK